MKWTLIAVTSALVFLMAFTGCTAPKEQPAEPQPPPQPTEPVPPPKKESILSVHFIDVGQGDSILIDLDDTEILIDGGDRSSNIVQYVLAFIDGPLEAMIATHPHADHIGGLISILDEFQVEQIWHNGDNTDSKTYSDFMLAVQSEGAQVHLGRRGDTINAGKITLLILSPTSLAGTTNNNSIVVSLNYGEVDFLFTGDAEHEAEGAMLIASDMPVPDIEILKLGHHGSSTSSSEDSLTITSPEIAIYMAGQDNKYGHPHQETISNLSKAGIETYGTDTCGNIVVTTDGKTYTLQTEK